MVARDVTRLGAFAVHRWCKPAALAEVKRREEAAEHVRRVQQITHQAQESASNLRRMGVWLPGQAV
jgi:hypothetical protein